MDVDDIELVSISVNPTEVIKEKPLPEAEPVSVLEELFSSYQETYTESPFKSFNLLSAAQRRAEMKRRLPEFGPCREVTFDVPDNCPGIYFKRFSSDGRVRY